MKLRASKDSTQNIGWNVSNDAGESTWTPVGNHVSAQLSGLLCLMLLPNALAAARAHRMERMKEENNKQMLQKVKEAEPNAAEKTIPPHPELLRSLVFYSSRAATTHTATQSPARSEAFRTPSKLLRRPVFYSSRAATTRTATQSPARSEAFRMPSKLLRRPVFYSSRAAITRTTTQSPACSEAFRTPSKLLRRPVFYSSRAATTRTVTQSPARNEAFRTPSKLLRRPVFYAVRAATTHTATQSPVCSATYRTPSKLLQRPVFFSARAATRRTFTQSIIRSQAFRMPSKFLRRPKFYARQIAAQSTKECPEEISQPIQENKILHFVSGRIYRTQPTTTKPDFLGYQHVCAAQPQQRNDILNFAGDRKYKTQPTAPLPDFLGYQSVHAILHQQQNDILNFVGDRTYKTQRIAPTSGSPAYQPVSAPIHQQKNEILISQETNENVKTSRPDPWKSVFPALFQPEKKFLKNQFNISSNQSTVAAKPSDPRKHSAALQLQERLKANETVQTTRPDPWKENQEDIGTVQTTRPDPWKSVFPALFQPEKNHLKKQYTVSSNQTTADPKPTQPEKISTALQPQEHSIRRQMYWSRQAIHVQASKCLQSESRKPYFSAHVLQRPVYWAKRPMLKEGIHPLLSRTTRIIASDTLSINTDEFVEPTSEKGFTLEVKQETRQFNALTPDLPFPWKEKEQGVDDSPIERSGSPSESLTTYKQALQTSSSSPTFAWKTLVQSKQTGYFGEQSNKFKDTERWQGEFDAEQKTAFKSALELTNRARAKKADWDKKNRKPSFASNLDRFFLASPLATSLSALQSVAVFAFLNMMTELLLKASHLKYPAPLVSMALLFLGFVVGDWALPQFNAAAFEFLVKGNALLLNWFPVLLLPSVISTLLVLPSFSAKRVLELAILFAGWAVATFSLNSKELPGHHQTIYKDTDTQLKVVKPLFFLESLFSKRQLSQFQKIFLGCTTMLVGLHCLPDKSPAAFLAMKAAQSMFLISLTSTSYVQSWFMPAKWSSIFHPVITSIGITFIGSCFYAALSGTKAAQVAEAFGTGAVTGFVFQCLLGATICSCACSIFLHKAALRDNSIK